MGMVKIKMLDSAQRLKIKRDQKTLLKD